MYLFLMSIPVASVIISNVTTVSTSVWPELEVNIHLMLLNCSLLQESFAAELTAMSLVLVPGVHRVHVRPHVPHHHAAQVALHCLLHAVSPDV